MKKNTLGKWMLAGAAMAFAFACQPKTPNSSDDKKDGDSCGCNSGCSSLNVTETTSQSVELQISSLETKADVCEEPTVHVIEIGDCAEDMVAEAAAAVTSDAVPAQAVVEEVPSVDQSQNQASSTMVEIPIEIIEVK